MSAPVLAPVRPGAIPTQRRRRTESQPGDVAGYIPSGQVQGLAVWRVALASFVYEPQRARVLRWSASLPTVLILALQVALSLRLHNVANSDEALYINAGHDYLTQWAGGPHAPSYYGGYFSGFPLAYPVLAGAIDRMGGLALVRITSLIMMMSATLAVGASARRICPDAWAAQCRHCAMLFFVLTGPVLVVGNFATYDAACMSLVAISAALAIGSESLGSALLAGLVVALAGVCKYSGAAFVPVIILLALLATSGPARALVRAACVMVSSVAGLAAVYFPHAAFIRPGIELTTTARTALNPRPLSLLIIEYGRSVGLLTVLALAGLVLLLRHDETLISSRHARRSAGRIRPVLLSVAMIGAGVAIPMSQLRIHEYTSFNKHLTFAAIFLAPVAGRVAAVRWPLLKQFALSTVVYVLTVGALFRSQFIYDEWPDSSPVIAAIQRADLPGTYIGVGADTMAYYSRGHPELSFEEPYSLFGSGRGAIRAAVTEDRYAGITFTSGTTANEQLDANVAYLAQLVRSNPDYEFAGSWPKHKYDLNRFYLYLRK